MGNGNGNRDGLVGVMSARCSRVVSAAATSGDGADADAEANSEDANAQRRREGPGSALPPPPPSSAGSTDARDALAATAVFYAFAAWQWLQWPLVAPGPSMVPPPHVAAAVAALATLLVSPLLARAAHPAMNYGVKWPLLVRAAFGTSAARGLTSARRVVWAAFAALHFLACTEALHLFLAVVAPAASVLGHGAWASASCYLLAWLLQSRGLAGLMRLALVRGGGAFVVVTALFAAKHGLFGGVVVSGAAAAGAAAATTAVKGKAAVAAVVAASTAGPAMAPALDIALALVGVWVVMSGKILNPKP